MYGRVCGVDDAVKDQPLAAWPYPTLYAPKVLPHLCSRISINDERVQMMNRYAYHHVKKQRLIQLISPFVVRPPSLSIIVYQYQYPIQLLTLVTISNLIVSVDLLVISSLR
jgi:hypothetical protein